ncbi:hypothetical protein K469DRAFT_700255 [Zopfia rhizophila CBS 207.26]|uniref:Uncharacterized protein n=1 Tax=Zopfia rhizophila CBS 207.26 TaxID=1314779 RepID=A0A6A6DB37_9PEZI|nr:hypothetical protein K469DRAFT_700255 [Zopfia rhizophila CBS 207.26]
MPFINVSSESLQHHPHEPPPEPLTPLIPPIPNHIPPKPRRPKDVTHTPRLAETQGTNLRSQDMHRVPLFRHYVCKVNVRLVSDDGEAGFHQAALIY